MLPTVEHPGDFPAVELGDALERLKREAINQIVSKIMDTFIYKGFTPEQVFDAFAEYIAKKLNNRPAVGLMEEVVWSFQNFEQEVKTYERIVGRRSQIPKSIEDLENPPLEDIRQEYESFLSELEALAVDAIASNDWGAFCLHISDFQRERLIPLGQEEPSDSPDFQRHTAIRDRIRTMLEALKAEGITRSELIECLGNEAHLLLIEDEREFKASADEMPTPSAGSSQTTAVNERKD